MLHTLPRREVAQRFSTFIQFANDRFERWVEEPRLKRSMKQALLRQGTELSQNSNPPVNTDDVSDANFPDDNFQKEKGNKDTSNAGDENLWIAYWHQRWSESRTELVTTHFYAYLQEPCYWSAHKLSRQFSATQASLSDCFQTALFRIDNILANFKPELGINLSTYASSIFSNAIRDLLSQSYEIQVCSDGSLLRRVTRKRFVEALRATGLDSKTIEQYELAWLSFKAVCFPSKKTVRRGQLSQADWQAIAQVYESQRQQSATPPPAAEAKQLETLLTEAVQHLRRALSPTPLSLNSGLEESEEFLDQVISGDDPLRTYIAKEELKLRQLRQQKMVRILQQTLLELDPVAQDILRLYYQDRLKQKEIAAQLETQQYSISRQLSKARQTLLAALVEWSRSDLHICLDSTVLNNISAFLEDWLQVHFSGDQTDHDAA